MGSICHRRAATLLTKNHLQIIVMPMMMIAMNMKMTMTTMMNMQMKMTSIKSSFVSSEATLDKIISGSRLVHKLKEIFNHLLCNVVFSSSKFKYCSKFKYWYIFGPCWLTTSKRFSIIYFYTLFTKTHILADTFFSFKYLVLVLGLDLSSKDGSP